MKRKLIKLSPSTSVVSLPSGWLKKNKVAKGAELEVREVDNEVLISASGSKAEQTITLDIRPLRDQLLWMHIDAAYVAGYDSIILQTNGSEQTALMSRVVQWFPGMMIHDERRDMVRLKDIAATTPEDTDRIVSRIFHVLVSQAEDMVGAIKEKDWTALKESKSRDYLLNAYVSFAQRQINKYGYKSFAKNGLVSTFLKLLEMLSDRICRYYALVGEMQASDEHSSVKDIRSLLGKLRELHFKYSQEALVAFEAARKGLRGRAERSQDVKPQLIEVADVLFDLEEVAVQINL